MTTEPSIIVYHTQEQVAALIQRCRSIRDEDRRFYRRETIKLVVYQIIVAAAIRLTADQIIARSKAYWLEPYVIPMMIAIVIAIWVTGIQIVFRRRY